MSKLSLVSTAVAACCALAGCLDAQNPATGSSPDAEAGQEAGGDADAGATPQTDDRADDATRQGGRDAGSPDALADAGSSDSEEPDLDSGVAADSGVGADGGVDARPEPQTTAPPCEVQAASVSAILNAAGGELEGPDCVTVGIREGTLDESREFGVRRVNDVTPTERFQTVGPVYELTPGEEKLSIPAIVTIPFELDEIPAFLTLSPRAGGSSARTSIRNLVVLYSADGSTWVELPGAFVGQALRVELGQLGWVALGTRRAGACRFTIERIDLTRTHVTNEQGLLVSRHERWSTDRNFTAVFDDYEEFEYDDLNRLTTATSLFTAGGDIVAEIPFLETSESATYVHSYSSLDGAEVEVIEEVGEDVPAIYTRTYDSDGNLLRVDRDWSGGESVSTTRHTYAAGVLVETEKFSSGGTPRTVATYDTDGRVLTRLEPASFDSPEMARLSYTYDDNGYLVRQTQQLVYPDGQPFTGLTTISDVRNPAGQLLERESLTEAQGVDYRQIETYEYDEAGYLTRQKQRTEDGSGMDREHAFSYTRDAAGHAIVEELSPMEGGWRIERTYDGNVLMLEEEFSDADGDGAYDWHSTTTHAYAEGLETSRVQEVDADGDGTVDVRNPQTATYEGTCDFASDLFDGLWRRVSRNAAEGDW